MEIDGIKFTKNKKTGYYLSTKLVDNKRIRLHRYIYQKHNGEIPKGYEVHHIDMNKDNNDISNLKLMPTKEHRKIHGKKLTDEQRIKLRNNMNNNARPKAIEWHKSEKGKEWHKEQYKKSLGNRKPILMICQNCQKEYYSINIGINKFCSSSCKSAYRKKSGVDNIERKCEKCGNGFITNKYSQRKYCKNCKSKKH